MESPGNAARTNLARGTVVPTQTQHHEDPDEQLDVGNAHIHARVNGGRENPGKPDRRERHGGPEVEYVIGEDLPAGTPIPRTPKRLSDSSVRRLSI